MTTEHKTETNKSDQKNDQTMKGQNPARGQVKSQDRDNKPGEQRPGQHTPGQKPEQKGEHTPDQKPDQKPDHKPGQTAAKR